MKPPHGRNTDFIGDSHGTLLADPFLFDSSKGDLMRSWYLKAIPLVIVAAAWACGGGSSSPSSPAPTGPITINILGDRGAQSFSPNPATAAGQQVVFRNTDSVVHRVQLNDGTLDTGDIGPGATSRAVTMPTAGTNYHCMLHAGMIGAVSRPDTAPPPCTGAYC
jgi:plastocyanin